MFALAADALRQILQPSCRAIVYKSLGLTIAVLALAWIVLERLMTAWLAPAQGWLATILSIIAGFGLFVGMIFLIAPITSLVAGFFLDDLAAIVETEIDPSGSGGRPLAAGQATMLAIRFFGFSLAMNIIALFLLLVPGVNLIAFLAVNAYVLGREYFELAAMRYRSIEAARALRQAHALEVFAAGLFIAGFLAIPLANLATPLFATALMVRLHHKISRAPSSEGSAAA
jgi:CysZ protein